MLPRHDLVLIVLPVLAGSGIAIQYIATLVTRSVEIAVGFPDLPLVPAGLLAAFAVVCHELFVEPPVEYH